jgi:hypothetical protein
MSQSQFDAIVQREQAKLARIAREDAEAENFNGKYQRLRSRFRGVRDFGEHEGWKGLSRKPTEEELARSFSRRIVHLGQELKNFPISPGMNVVQRLKRLSRRPEAKRLAIEVLLLGVEGDEEEICRRIQKIDDLRSKLAADFFTWLRYGLEREILQYRILAESGDGGVMRPVRQEWETGEQWQAALAAVAVEPSKGIAQISQPLRELSRTEKAVLAIIKAQPKGKGIVGKGIITKLKQKKIELLDSTLRRHILPKLKVHCGVITCRSRRLSHPLI